MTETKMSCAAASSAKSRECKQRRRRSPLAIGIVGFGRFGQFLARTLAKHAAKVVVTSRSDHSLVAREMGVTYVPLSDPTAFLSHHLDVVILSVSIVSFEGTLRGLLPHLSAYIRASGEEEGGSSACRSTTTTTSSSRATRSPLFVDVLSVKEHPRRVMLDLLPAECDVLCTHPMFGPDSGRNGWHGLRFVYERTRLGGVVLQERSDASSTTEYSEVREERMDDFLSIWEEEGCCMVPLSCREHDAHAANSQFVTHLTGRILGGHDSKLRSTPINTKGFEQILELVDSTSADSFDLFYGLYKYNRYSMDVVVEHRRALDGIIRRLQSMEDGERPRPTLAPAERELREQQLNKRRRTCAAFTI